MPDPIPTVASPITRREDFGKLLNSMGLAYVAIEVGTDKGYFANALLEQWDGNRLICIDPWSYKLEEYDDVLSDRNRTPDLLMAVVVLSKHVGRVEMLEMTGEAAIDHRQVKEYAGQVSCVYLDADHSYASVCKDIAMFWPLIAPGGILAGHDWNLPDVEKAVRHFAENNQLEPIHLIAGDAWTWYIIKPKEAANV